MNRVTNFEDMPCVPTCASLKSFTHNILIPQDRSLDLLIPFGALFGKTGMSQAEQLFLLVKHQLAVIPEKVWWKN